jgi:hypothetical protein
MRELSYREDHGGTGQASARTEQAIDELICERIEQAYRFALSHRSSDDDPVYMLYAMHAARMTRQAIDQMQVSKRIISRELRRYTDGQWRMVPIYISRASCTAMSDPFPEGGPWLAIEVRCNPDGGLVVYLIKKEQGDGCLLPGEQMSFSRDDVDYWLSLDPPWILDLQ